MSKCFIFKNVGKYSQIPSRYLHPDPDTLQLLQSTRLQFRQQQPFVVFAELCPSIHPTRRASNHDELARCKFIIFKLYISLAVNRERERLKLQQCPRGQPVQIISILLAGLLPRCGVLREPLAGRKKIREKRTRRRTAKDVIRAKSSFHVRFALETTG